MLLTFNFLFKSLLRISLYPLKDLRLYDIICKSKRKFEFVFFIKQIKGGIVMVNLYEVDKHEVSGTKENLAYEVVDKFHAYDEAVRIESVFGVRRFGEGSAESLYIKFSDTVAKVVSSKIGGDEFAELLSGAVEYYNLNALCPCDNKVDEAMIVSCVAKASEEILNKKSSSEVQDAEAGE